MKKVIEQHAVWYFTQSEVVQALMDYVSSLKPKDRDINQKGISSLRSLADGPLTNWDYSLTVKTHESNPDEEKTDEGLEEKTGRICLGLPSSPMDRDIPQQDTDRPGHYSL